MPLPGPSTYESAVLNTAHPARAPGRPCRSGSGWRAAAAPHLRELLTLLQSPQVGYARLRLSLGDAPPVQAGCGFTLVDRKPRPEALKRLPFPERFTLSAPVQRGMAPREWPEMTTKLPQPSRLTARGGRATKRIVLVYHPARRSMKDRCRWNRGLGGSEEPQRPSIPPQEPVSQPALRQPGLPGARQDVRGPSDERHWSRWIPPNDLHVAGVCR